MSSTYPPPLIRRQKRLQTHIRRIDRTSPRKQEHVIQQTAKGAAHERRHHRDPEVVVPRRPHLMPIPQPIRHDPRPQVPCHIDRRSRLPAETGTNAVDDEKQRQRCQRPRAEIPVVLDRVDEEQKDGAGDEFGEELARLGHEGGGVGAEDAGGGGVAVAGHGADAGAALVDVDGGSVVGVDDERGAASAEELGEHVGREFAPGEAAEDAVGEGDGWVEMGAGDAGGVDAEHETEAGDGEKGGCMSDWR